VYGAMGGYHGDHPPADLKGFLEFARSLSQPEVFDVLSQSELLAPIVRYRIPSSNRRHYSAMPRFPLGVLPLGDSVCDFDPSFGQGITVTALEAESLADSMALREASAETVRIEYLKRIESVIDVAWGMSSGENFKYPQTTGQRPRLYTLCRHYRDLMATCGDPRVVHDFYRVLALTAPPGILLRPSVVARALGLRIRGLRVDSRHATIE
jgi:hypothetical protein